MKEADKEEKEEKEDEDEEDEEAMMAAWEAEKEARIRALRSGDDSARRFFDLRNKDMRVPSSSAGRKSLIACSKFDAAFSRDYFDYTEDWPDEVDGGRRRRRRHKKGTADDGVVVGTIKITFDEPDGESFGGCGSSGRTEHVFFVKRFAIVDR